jgi:rubrerythrin
MPLPAAYDLDFQERNEKDASVRRMEAGPGNMPGLQEEEMARGKQMESICTNCGFQIVTDYPYPQPCPLCGEQLTQGKPAAAPRGNKKSKGAKKNGN